MIDIQYPASKQDKEELTVMTVVVKPRKPMTIFKANLDDGILPEWEDDMLTLEDVINELCFDNPSFRDKLDEAKKHLDSLTAQEHNELIDNVFRRI